MYSNEDHHIRDKHYPAFIVIFLITIILINYWSVQSIEFVNYDDDLYVTENVHVQSGITKESVIWACTTFHAGNWHPLTWLSLMFDYELYRLNPAGYHWANVLFHIANTLLLFLVLNRMTGALWRSAMVAALFAIHPINVESVAWVAERKNVLSTFFWILTMLFYVWYVKQLGWKRYLPVFICFALGLMSKPMLVTLPFVLLLLDYWPLRRIHINISSEDQEILPEINTRKQKVYFLILEKMPLFVLVVIFSCITLYAQRTIGTLSGFDILPVLGRISNAIFSYVLYIKKLFWPTDLAVLYPLAHIPIWQVTSAGLFLLIVTILVVKYLRKYPFMAIGWFWYLGTLIPVSGIVQVGVQAMADRYAYVPFIGLFILIVWGTSAISQQWRHRRPILLISTGFVLVPLMICTWFQVKHWENGISLFQHAVSVAEGNSISINNLGNELARKGRIEEAMLQYKKAITLQPNFVEVYINMGKILTLQGKVKEAIVQYNKALQLKPRNIKAQFNIGVAYSELGNIRDAILHYNEVLRINPDFVAAYNNLGIIYANQGDFDKAVFYFQKALAIFPNFDSAKNNLRIAQEQRDDSHLRPR